MNMYLRLDELQQVNLNLLKCLLEVHVHYFIFEKCPLMKSDTNKIKNIHVRIISISISIIKYSEGNCYDNL